MGKIKFAVPLVALVSSAGILAQTPAISLPAHQGGAGRIEIPQSGIVHEGDAGLRAHTQFKILVPAGRPEGVIGFSKEESAPALSRQAVQPIAGYYAETPASLACIYAEVSVGAGCNPATLTLVASGGSKAIAIVDAFHYPTALADLTAYSKQFGLPVPTSSTFTVAYQGTSAPGTDPDCASYGGWNCWSAEAALDIEMAHAMAPSAHIYLVEANSSSFADLFATVTKAAALVKAAGGGEVSMSWGGGEFSGETQYDSTFLATNVVFFASSGDSEGTIYPSVSPNVVAVGGTTIARNPSTLAFEAEITWEDTGGGISPLEPRPAFQNSISTLVGAHRGTPDVAAVGNPRTGVWVYDSFDNTSGGTLYPWNIFGGTSVASPLFAGVVNHAGHFSASTAAEEAVIYANVKTSNYRDIAIGTCGYYEGWLAALGWDPCSGVGSPLGSTGK